MSSPQGNPARREPLLWLQLLGLAALPLEGAALLLVLAGADPGPLPGLERVFGWALGALAPAALFWSLPPDLWSLLLLQVPVRGRRPDQLRLSALQTALPLKLLGAAGAPLLLPLLWWSDRAAGLAWSVSPFTTTPRVLVLLLAAALLALMLWQWQQIVQALWMLSRPPAQIAQTLPLSPSDAAERRLNLGLPLLLLPALQQPPAEACPPAERAAPIDRQPEPEPEPIAAATVLDSVQTVQNPEQPDNDTATPAPAPGHDAAPPEPVIAAPAEWNPEAQPATDPEAAPSEEIAPAPTDLGAAAPEQASAPDQSAAAEEAVVAEVAVGVEEAVGDAGSQAPQDPLESSGASSALIPVAVEPEQAAEDPQGADLDQQV